ncbi:MAG TPA: amidohydrolase family protein [Microthrixaceae bacterium]|nr:amidohydrolase family protein [Microthrixaceae bacterium]
MATLLRGGTVFDGDGGPGRRADVLVVDDRVERIGEVREVPPDTVEIDATGCWVTPGFVDIHTHYDAELEFAPSLSESLRHGVTTVLVGSCGLSFAVGEPEDLADMFCRVEGVPRDGVLPLLERVVDWDSPAGYLDHLSTLPLGPNVVSLLGHSAIRARAMGFGRSVDERERPTPAELDLMVRMVDEALDAGYLGLSVNTLPWDKLDGSRYRSRPTPSVFARWSEYRALVGPVRDRGAVFQAVPNIQTRWNLALFAALASKVGHPPLRTMLISMADTVSVRGLHRALGAFLWVARRALGADLRMQSLPNVFDMWIDGLENPIIEELGAGTEVLHLDRSVRGELMTEPGWRRRFRSQWTDKLRGRVYHRDLREARIVGAPEPGLVGRTFAEVAAERGVDPLDCFMDLIAEHGNHLRWHTVIANDRRDELEWIAAHPQVLIGFSDAGAHLRNMGFYNFPLQLLRLAADAQREGREFMSIGRAVHRVTGELADYLGIDAGRLRAGGRADLVVVDPEGLDDSLDELHEVPMPGFPDLDRLVRRNDRAVRAVVVNGRVAWDGRECAPDLGKADHYGQLLRGRY